MGRFKHGSPRNYKFELLAESHAWAEAKTCSLSKGDGMPDFTDPVVLMVAGIVIIVVSIIVSGGGIVSMIRGLLDGNMSSAANGFIYHILAIAGVVIGFVVFVLGLVLALLPKSTT